MASTIISGTIDGAYPVAGVDNDTQGFRDNFTIIKTGLATAASEVTALQANTAKLNYQSMSVNLAVGVGTINFALADWPARDHVAKMTVQLKGNDTAKTVTFTVAGGGTIKYSADFPATLTLDSSVNPILIDFWTYNQGTTVYAEYRGQYT